MYETNQRPMPSRYIIGIDLGTTNCALSYIDTLDPTVTVRQLPILQWADEQSTLTSELLPSFILMPEPRFVKAGQKNLEFHPQSEAYRFVVGHAAKEAHATQTQRVIHSAKSWLSQPHTERRGGILPWASDEILGDNRLSPVQASALLLSHLKMQWDHVMARFEENYQFVKQDIIITIPASFDEVAQQLTLEAAYEAGYPASVRLLEEPLAAFYALRRESLGQAVPNGRILVCDVGGGTTDLTLIEHDASSGTTERTKVSEHILLGGDNIDLALAHEFEKNAGTKLDSYTFNQLVAECRRLKERVLSEEAAKSAAHGPDRLLHITTSSRGKNLFQSTMTFTLPYPTFRSIILEGFFPIATADSLPHRRTGGLASFGLSYAPDSAITRYLAEFMHGHTIDAVLFTGGCLKPEFLQERLIAVLSSWQQQKVQRLLNPLMDLAVAHGAAHYGYILRSKKEARVKAGYPRTIFVETTRQDNGLSELICLVPKGYDEGTPLTIAIPGLMLRLGEPVKFSLYASSEISSAAPGTRRRHDSSITPLYSVQTQLSPHKGDPKPKPGREILIPISLKASIGSTGILELSCVRQDASEGETHEWRLNFAIRKEQQPDSASLEEAPEKIALSEEARVQIKARIDASYGKNPPSVAAAAGSPSALTGEIERLLMRERDQWDIAVLRILWPMLAEGMTRRGRSAAHETAWYYLAGYSLRPGFGDDLDKYRVAELWRAWQQGVTHQTDAKVMNQWWIMWRRVAGGLERHPQEQIYAKIFPLIRAGKDVAAEIYLLAGSLERLEMNKKIQLGNLLTTQIAASRAFLDQKIWALSRLASRVPLYGGIDTIVRPSFIAKWFNDLIHIDVGDKRYQGLNQFYAQAGRLIGEREFDLDDELREKFLKMMNARAAAPHQIEMVERLMPIDRQSQSQLFGEELPSGLILAL
jgi:molecular chaperone DnaK (HSP70)